MENLATYISDGLHKLSNKTTARQMQNELDTTDFFYGVRTIDRRNLLKSGIKRNPITTLKDYEVIVQRLFSGYSTEEHYCAIDIADAYKEYQNESTLDLFSKMIQFSNSTDIVDTISYRLVGPLVYKIHSIEQSVEKWADNDNIWFRRASIMAHYHQKRKTNLMMLKFTIEKLQFDNEFLIQKAIGMVLQELSKYNQAWVEDFIEHHPRLSNLCRREALRHIKRGQQII